jgi:hypothetical protein
MFGMETPVAARPNEERPFPMDGARLANILMVQRNDKGAGTHSKHHAGAVFQINLQSDLDQY